MQKIKKYIKLNLRKLTGFDKFIIVGTVFAFLFLAYIFFRKSAYINIVIKVGEENVMWTYDGSRTWFAGLFKIGMKEQDGLGRANAIVTNIYSYNVSPTREAVYLTLRLKAVYNRSQNKYTYKGMPVLVGSPMKLFLDDLYVQGLVVDMDADNNIRNKKKLLVDVWVKQENSNLDSSGEDAYISEFIKIGDEIRDNRDRAIVKVRDKKVEDAKKVVTTSDGRILVQRNPLRKDIYLTLEINATEINEKYYLFDDIPILVGYVLPLNFDFISIWPEVTNIIYD